MQQDNHGNFKQIMDTKDLEKKLYEQAGELENTEAIHTGTPEFLKKVKNEKRVFKAPFEPNDVKLDRIERKLNRLLLHLDLVAPDEILIV
jgi:hypothetical protein